MHKTCKYHKLEFTTELIFCSNPKSSLKIKEAFWPGNQGDADFWVSLQEYVIPATFYLTCQFQSDCTSLFSGWNQFVLNWCTRPNWQSTCETSRHTPLCFCAFMSSGLVISLRDWPPRRDGGLHFSQVDSVSSFLPQPAAFFSPSSAPSAVCTAAP